MRHFWHDKAGNFGILTALLAVPMFGAAGVALDISQAMVVKQDLQNAADAAALAAVAKSSKEVEAARKMKADGKIVIPENEALSFFEADAVGRNDFEVESVNVSVEKVGNVVQSNVSFSATVQTSLSRILGKNFMTVSVKATAKYETETYSDFYLLLDNTPSMGVGATPADVKKMVDNTKDKCAFACHVVSIDGVDDKNSYYHLAKKLGVTTRINVVAQATAALMDTATSLRKTSDQYRMAVYTFGEKAQDAELTEVVPLTTNLANAKKKAEKIDLMSALSKKSSESQLTDFDNTLTALGTKMGTVGNGTSSASPDKVVFFVSDGVGDSYKTTSCTKRANNGRCQEPIDTRFCTALKEKGYRIAVLYTTYLPLPEDDWYNTWISPFQSQISTRMEECATPGLYFEVSPTEGISDAMAALFKRIITSPRLTS
ncbi:MULTISPECIES: pilus assembly protein TadG-related protein [unclassified Rhizobium]|uniref:pilus assembly protein TadG-related protein n=1 Tax=unclassified Rhizobium TaxID=2613769 RepID=UPI0017827C89|nr:TadE/TadG family protein [Rhizobium sp. CFBP 13644]MBD8690682.1 TadE/TadG family protein [Rhizobium sp. CFBP 13717]